MSIRAQFAGVCPRCESGFREGDEISAYPEGWGHTECVEEPNVDDRPRCRWCGSPLDADLECTNCEQTG